MKGIRYYLLSGKIVCKRHDYRTHDAHQKAEGRRQTCAWDSRM